MLPEELAKAIGEDRAAGRKPFCVIATVGTTGLTSVDPVRAIARITKPQGLWLHVDAAYGGSAAIAPEFQHYLDGVDEAESLVVNPHKWLLTGMDLSVLYTRRPDILRRAFSLTPDYLAYGEDPRKVNLMDYGVPLGRAFRSLKLWFVLRYYGRERLAEMIREHCRFARELAAEIARDERFEILAPVTMSLVCFRYRGSDEENRRLVEAINSSGFAFLSQSSLQGRFMIRWAIGNFQTSWDDLMDVWARVRSLIA
jgi:aromatic-L-amino-acid decarboxylase